MRRSGTIALLAFLQLMVVLVLPASAQQVSRSKADCSLTTIGALPLNDLGAGDYQGEQGGLYPGGSNEVPDDHAALGLWHAAQIVPRNQAGEPDPDGTIVVLSIGVSNTRSEFGQFRRKTDGALEPDVILVNGAQPGEDIAQWQSIESHTWRNIEGALQQNDVTAEQVQAAWLKLPDIVQNREQILPFPANSLQYRDQLAAVVQNAGDLYPNLRVIYLSSRIYAGYNTSGRPSPEPLAYENGFGVKWLIADQIAGDMSLNADERRGPVESPWLSWGPYMWAGGTTPRSDGLVWECSDLQDDGIHPSQSGAGKVADMLVAHFTTDPTAAPWFAADGEPIGSVELPPVAAVPETTAAPTTTEAPDEPGSTTTTTTTTTDPRDGSERPGAPDREQREADRLAAQAEREQSESDTAVLIGTVVVLAVLLGAAGLIVRRRREPDAPGDE